MDNKKHTTIDFDFSTSGDFTIDQGEIPKPLEMKEKYIKPKPSVGIGLPKPKTTVTYKTKKYTVLKPLPEKIKVKVNKRVFKMSDFKFPPVKRVNTRLACSELQTDLKEDVLEDIISLKIDI